MACQERSVDDALDALADVQRRKLLMGLLNHNPQDDESVKIADSETDAAALERMIEMKHVHLPKLENYGFIEWDRDRNEVSKGPAFEEIRPLLELLADHDDDLPEDWL